LNNFYSFDFIFTDSYAVLVHDIAKVLDLRVSY